MTTQSELGFELELLIHNSLSIIPEIKCLREQDIRNYFGDQSFNGVDHWIKYKNNHILIQDKWKENMAQPEISQYLSCVDRIQSRNSQTDNYYLLWVSKKEPTSNSLKCLSERNVNLIICSSSIYSLASLVVLDVCNLLNVDPTESLKKIPSNILLSTICVKNSNQLLLHTKQKVNYEDTDEFKNKKEEILSLINHIHNGLYSKINRIVCSCPNIIPRELYNTEFPKTMDDWQKSKANKLDYNKFLNSLKKICIPSKNKKVYYATYNTYIKLCSISKDLSELTQTYNNLRNELIIKKSTWAKGLLDIKCSYTPYTQEEYKINCIYCDGYWKGMEYQFMQEYHNTY